jgi:type IV secretion system protein VirB6
MISPPIYTDIVIKTLSEIDMLLHNYVYNSYEAFSSYLRIPLGLISTIYIVILGYGIMMGWVRMTTGNFVKAVLKVGLVYTAVTEWSFVSQYFVGFIDNVIGELGDALISASPTHIPGVSGIDGAMQLTLIQFTKIGSMIFNTGGFTNMGGWLDGVVIWGFGYLIIGVGLFEIILAKVMLAILFIFTPVLSMFTYFKPLQSVFDRWLGAIVGFALLQLFVTAAMTLALSLAYWWTGAHILETALQIGSYGTLPVIIIGIVCVGLIMKAANLAQNLGGMVSTASGAAMVGGMVGGAVGSAFSATRSGASTLGKLGGLKRYAEGLIHSGVSKSASGAKSVMSGISSSLKRGD